MNSKRSHIMWKINLWIKVSIISGMCVKNCLKEKTSYSEQPSRSVLKSTICVGVSFLIGLKLYLQTDSGTVAFLWTLRILRMTASKYRNNMPREVYTKCEKNESMGGSGKKLVIVKTCVKYKMKYNKLFPTFDLITLYHWLRLTSKWWGVMPEASHGIFFV